MMTELFVLFVCAACIIYKLSNVLGTESEQDLDRARKKSKTGDYPLPGDTGHSSSNILDLDKENVQEVIVVDNTLSPEIAEIIKTINHMDPNFTQSYFIQGAETVFESVISAIAKGKVQDVSHLLSKTIHTTLKKHIQQREEKGSYIETTLVSVTKKEIISATLTKNIGEFTIRFTSDQINLERNFKDNTIIGGDAGHTLPTQDIWIFQRDMKSNTPEWLVTSITRTTEANGEGENNV